VKPIHWVLREIWPSQGQLFQVIKRWRESRSDVLRGGFPSSRRGDLNSLTGADKRPWRLPVAATLYAMDWAYRSQVLRLAGLKTLPVWKTWRMLNCPPAGGRWEPMTRANGHAGSPCMVPICPWCHIRRTDEILRAASALFERSEVEATAFVMRRDRLITRTEYDTLAQVATAFAVKCGGKLYRIACYRYDQGPSSRTTGCAVSQVYIHGSHAEALPQEQDIEIKIRQGTLRELVTFSHFHSAGLMAADVNVLSEILSVLSRRKLVGSSGLSCNSSKLGL
jgi:hypothetical protein